MARLYINKIHINKSLIVDNTIKVVFTTFRLDTHTTSSIKEVNDFIHTQNVQLINSNTYKTAANIIKDGGKVVGIDFKNEIYINVFGRINETNDYHYLDCQKVNNQSATGSLVSEKTKFNFEYHVKNEGDTIISNETAIKNYSFIIESIEALKIQEDGFLGNGDEIYFKWKLDNKNAKRHPNKYYKFKKKGYIKPVNYNIKIENNQTLYVELWDEDVFSDDYLGVFAWTAKNISSTHFSHHVFNKDGARYKMKYRIIPNTETVIQKLKLGEDFLKNTVNIQFDSYINNLDQIKQLVNQQFTKTQLTSIKGSVPNANLMYSIMKNINPENSEDSERINTFIKNYYETFSKNIEVQGQYLQEILNSQHPLMAYPVFPEPVYYYLKQISNSFILPAVDAMPLNSMAMFVNTPEFIEAFLCGMNTEMSKELLWREYPTDSRGSYFRKFWDTEMKKEMADELINNTFFDVKPLHQWNQKLGSNHEGAKSELLIFAIKAEVLKKYPETMVFLSQASLDENKILLNIENSKILPELTAWLNADTFLVGFPVKLNDVVGNPATKDPGFFLTFMNKPTETRFAFNNQNSEIKHSAKRATQELVRPQAYGKHIVQFISGWN